MSIEAYYVLVEIPDKQDVKQHKLSTILVNGTNYGFEFSKLVNRPQTKDIHECLNSFLNAIVCWWFNEFIFIFK